MDIISDFPFFNAAFCITNLSVTNLSVVDIRLELSQRCIFLGTNLWYFKLQLLDPYPYKFEKPSALFSSKNTILNYIITSCCCNESILLLLGCCPGIVNYCLLIILLTVPQFDLPIALTSNYPPKKGGKTKALIKTFKHVVKQGDLSSRF